MSLYFVFCYLSRQGRAFFHGAYLDYVFAQRSAEIQGEESPDTRCVVIRKP